MEPFTGNQALNLLYFHYVENPLPFTESELAHLKLELIGKWDEVNSPYRKHLVAEDLHSFITDVSRGNELFKQQLDN